ncbi:MAG: type II toxin-antitoxin system RelE/ParE family toxin [Candidatus Riflebacteria bacterium]|nr:type II toxin-antitoxin system RelE/ParE family toxin [Candidatus Riflebacteria bacterium]
MILSFCNQGSEDIFDRKDTRAARRVCPQTLWNVARRKLDQLNAVVSLASLSIPPGNCLEPLQGSRIGQHSIRINAQFRICFIWSDEGVKNVEIVDYH